MKKTKPKTLRISFQEKTPKGFVERSFSTCKEHLEFHLQQMQDGTNGVVALKKSPDIIRQVSFKSV